MRNKSIKIRVTNSEHEQLLMRANGNQLASWMRLVCLDQKVPRSFPPVDPNLLFQIAQIGNNLNQIARKLNTLELSSLEKVEAAFQLNDIRISAQEIKKAYAR